MTPKTKADWHVVLLSYPCPTCRAVPGEPCITKTGQVVHSYTHAGRAAQGRRCPVCGTRLHHDAEAGALCPRCALVRALEVERATKYRRTDP